MAILVHACCIVISSSLTPCMCCRSFDLHVPFPCPRDAFAVVNTYSETDLGRLFREYGLRNIRTFIRTVG
jgi:hypothetical protein